MKAFIHATFFVVALHILCAQGALIAEHRDADGKHVNFPGDLDNALDTNEVPPKHNLPDSNITTRRMLENMLGNLGSTKMQELQAVFDSLSSIFSPLLGNVIAPIEDIIIPEYPDYIGEYYDYYYYYPYPNYPNYPYPNYPYPNNEDGDITIFTDDDGSITVIVVTTRDGTVNMKDILSKVPKKKIGENRKPLRRVANGSKVRAASKKGQKNGVKRGWQKEHNRRRGPGRGQKGTPARRPAGKGNRHKEETPKPEEEETKSEKEYKKKY